MASGNPEDLEIATLNIKHLSAKDQTFATAESVSLDWMTRYLVDYVVDAWWLLDLARIPGLAAD